MNRSGPLIRMFRGERFIASFCCVAPLPSRDTEIEPGDRVNGRTFDYYLSTIYDKFEAMNMQRKEG